MSDDDQLYKFMIKIYYEMQQNFRELNAEIRHIKKETHRNTVFIDFIDNEIEWMGMKVSNNLIPMDNCILENIKGMDKEIVSLEAKIEKLKMDINSIMIKESNNNSRIIEVVNNFKRSK